MKNNSIDDGSQRVHLRVWDLLPWIVNGTASDSARRDVEAHVSDCEHCRAELTRQQRVHAAMNADADAQVALPVERGLERLLESVDAHEQQAARYTRAGGTGRSRWAWVACGLAAMVLLEAGGLVGLGTSHRNTSSYHTLSSPDAGLPQAEIRLVVDPSMTAGKLQALLVALHLQIVAGPNEDGVYSLGVIGPGHDIEKDTAALRAAPGVRFVEPADGSRNAQ
ncbi:zf-HC2 domain-containing protein [bacterium]|nr:MAG: zf-HC2 domain-containing protein [bacterium]